MLEYFIIASYLIENVAFYTDHNYRTEAGADQEIFQWGVEEETFERNMFVDTHINACTHKN